MKKPSKKTISLILTGVAVAGVPLTAMLSAKDAPRYEDVLASCKEKKFGKARAVGKTYWKAFVSGGVTVLAIIFAEKVNLTEIAGLATTAAFLAKNRDKLEQKILELAGNENGKQILKQIKQEVNEEMIKEVYICSAGPSVEETGRGDLLCYEAYSGRWFRSCQVAVDRAIRELNDAFEAGEYLCLNDFYERLGLETTHFGHQFGWPANPDYVDGPIMFNVSFLESYEINDDNPKGQLKMLNEAVLLIEPATYPMECWLEV
jgi:hypothetical protein